MFTKIAIRKILIPWKKSYVVRYVIPIEYSNAREIVIILYTNIQVLYPLSWEKL